MDWNDIVSRGAITRRLRGLLVAAMLVAVAGLGFFSGTLAAGAGRSSDDVALHTVCIAPTVSMVTPMEDETILKDYTFVFTD